MNYEDELDRSRARKSRRRESESETSAKRRTHRTEDLYSMSADPGSRAGRAAAKSHGAASHNHRRRKNGNKKKKIIIGVLIALIVLVLGFAAKRAAHRLFLVNFRHGYLPSAARCFWACGAHVIYLRTRTLSTRPYSTAS